MVGNMNTSGRKGNGLLHDSLKGRLTWQCEVNGEEAVLCEVLYHGVDAQGLEDSFHIVLQLGDPDVACRVLPGSPSAVQQASWQLQSHVRLVYLHEQICLENKRRKLVGPNRTQDVGRRHYERTYSVAESGVTVELVKRG